MAGLGATVIAIFASIIFVVAPQAAQAVDTPVPNVTLTVGPPTAPITITLPPRTITVPPHTVTVTKPGKIKTVKVRELVTVPAPTVTRFLTRPARTVTIPPRTVTRTKTIPVGISLPRQTTTRYVTLVQEAQTVTETSTVTATVKAPVETVRGEDNTVVLTRTEFVGFSALFVAAGIIGTLLVCYLLFALGWLRGDGGNRKFMREMRDELKY